MDERIPLFFTLLLVVSVFTVNVRADDGSHFDTPLALGMSGLEEVEEEPEELEEPEPEPEGEGEEQEIPAIHALMGVSTRSIISQANYPYTGGAFIAASTNYGTGLMIIPEPYKVNTFGFVKNTDRVVNLTNSTVSGYWIMGGTTYSLRFSAYGEAQYYYTVGTTSTWRVLTVSSMTDSNVQFLDETGERGIQRPHLTLQEKIILAFLSIEIGIHALALLKGRG